MNPKQRKFTARIVAAMMLFVLLAGSTPGAVRSAYAAPGDLTRVSVDSSGAQANGRSYGGQLSADGRYVAFASGAPNLVAGDTNNVEDIFLKDRQSGATIRVSLASGSGAQANDGSGETVAISSNGHFVAFESSATDLVAVDTNGLSDVFVRDLQSGTTTLVSVDSAGVQANDASGRVSISGDGRFVAFHSDATNLVANDTNNAGDVFVRDIQTGVTIRASVDSSGVEANSGAFSAKISSNGRYVVFASSSTNLVSGDTNGVRDIFVHDIQTRQTTRESVNSSGVEVYMLAEDPSISGDGRFVTFSSASENLMSEDNMGFEHVYVRDRQLGTTTLVSRYSAGNPMQGRSDASQISADGRYVAFSHDDRGDSLPDRWIYVHDRMSYQTVRATPVGPLRPFLSADGRFLAYDSANPLVAGDTNGEQDVFVKEMAYPADLNPTVVEIQPSCSGSFCPYPTGPLITFRVTFSEFVSGVTADDFALTTTGGISGASVASIKGAANYYAVNVNTGTGDGTLRLDIIDNDSIQDIALHPLGGAGAGNGNFITGGVYVVDKNIPAVISSARVDPNPATGAFVNFAVTFSEDVTGVDALDFNPYPTGNISGAVVSEVTGSGKNYNVKVSTGSGDGTLQLHVIDNDSIRDSDNHPIGGDGADNGTFTQGEVYTIDRVPVVMSSLRLDPNPTSAGSVNFVVTFSESVSGVDAGDFVPTVTGNISGASVTNVSGAGNIYTVTVNTGTGDGTLRLDILDDDSIADAASNRLGGAGIGNGTYIAGDTYQVERNGPAVISILRVDANPIASDNVRFVVTFSEAVSGVDAGDFMLAITDSVSGASILNVIGSANMYIVAASTGAGNGTLRLDLLDNDSILDSVNQPLGGLGAGNGNFTAGEAYTISKVVITPVSEAFRSTGAGDGWALESSEDSSVGGSKNSNAAVFKLGDDGQDRQFRSVLHFPTYYLPDNAVVTQVILMIKKQDVVGSNPFNTHQNISVDIRNGLFGNFNIFEFGSLQAADFQAPADMYAVGAIQNNPVGDWYWTMLESRAFPYVNLSGVTQIRLGFQLDDNDDLGDDYIRFYSGDYDAQGDRPHLQIEYYVPR